LNVKEIYPSSIVGVKGLILNEYSQPIPSTTVMIDNRQPVVKVTALGEFWRILLPGTYTLKVRIHFFFDRFDKMVFFPGSLSRFSNL
jgi:hypothetical protein